LIPFNFLADWREFDWDVGRPGNDHPRLFVRRPAFKLGDIQRSRRSCHADKSVPTEPAHPNRTEYFMGVILSLAGVVE
jgi:hypothetical protein